MKFKWPMFSFTCIFLTVMGFSVAAEGRVDWEIQKTLKLKSSPKDVAVSKDGNYIFILTDADEIMAYKADGTLQDTIVPGGHIGDIEAGPKENILILSSRADNSIRVLNLDFIQKINITGSPVRGEVTAPVTIVLFAEFQCPYCARLMPLLQQVLEKNEGKVKLVFKHYPLKMHKFALAAAVAAQVAAKTDEFWVFHDSLFENYNKLSNEKILDIATQLGFDSSSFEKEMKDPAIHQKIQTDVRDGSLAGVRGVPKIFINGKLLKERSLKGFQKIIDAELKKISP